MNSQSINYQFIRLYLSQIYSLINLKVCRQSTLNYYLYQFQICQIYLKLHIQVSFLFQCITLKLKNQIERFYSSKLYNQSIILFQRNTCYFIFPNFSSFQPIWYIHLNFIDYLINLMSSSLVSQRQQSPKKKQNKLVCLEQNIQLPSNLLQHRKNILQQFRMLKSSQQSRKSTPRQTLTLMSKTFSTSRDKSGIKNDNKFQMLVEQRIVSTKVKPNGKQKVIKNPLYKRLSNIQAQTKQLSGVSFSKLLSRMQIIESQQKDQSPKISHDYRSRKSSKIQTKLRSIPNYQCLESKLFTIQCPQSRYQNRYDLDNGKQTGFKSMTLSPNKNSSPITNRLFRRYFNPHGQKSQIMSQYQTVQFDQRYIYRNGKKAQCKRIHNFYTSNMFRKSFQKHMRHTIDAWNPVPNNSKQQKS